MTSIDVTKRGFVIAVRRLPRGLLTAVVPGGCVGLSHAALLREGIACVRREPAYLKSIRRQGPRPPAAFPAISGRGPVRRSSGFGNAFSHAAGLPIGSAGLSCGWPQEIKSSSIKSSNNWSCRE